MSDTPKRRRFWQFHLSTAIWIMFALPVAAYIILRMNPWIPEAGAMSDKEFEARFPGWLKENPRKHIKSPDGARSFSIGVMDNCIYDAKNQRFEGRLFDFSIRDFDSETKFALGECTDGTPIHAAYGFIDDNRCVMTFVSKVDKIQYFRVWNRRFPEFWWGQFYRPEIWVGVVIGLVLIWKFIRRNRPEANGNKP